MAKKSVGPRTTNSDLAAMLDAFIENEGDKLSTETYALLDEAATRLRENGDDDQH